MKNQIEELVKLLVKVGLTEELALEKVKNISNESYNCGYDEGKDYKPSKIGISLGSDGLDFYEWWNNEINKK